MISRTTFRTKHIAYCVSTVFLFIFLYWQIQKTSIATNNSNVDPAKTFFDWESTFFSNFSFEIVDFYRHSVSSRNSSFPLISGDTFRAFSDHIFDETTDSDQWMSFVPKIKKGDIVFVQSLNNVMGAFFLKVFDSIPHPIVLVTHNSDASAPTVRYRWALDTTKIIAWFTQNPDYIHEKLFPIPIGIANPRWAHGNVSVFLKAFSRYRKPFEQRKKLLYVNFDSETNKIDRNDALFWIRKSFGRMKRQQVPHEIYLKEMGDAKFVLSPPGNGLDCHRTWEALLMGAVPIVLGSALNPLYENESILVIEEWSSLTPEYLRSLRYNPGISEKLFAKYWYSRLRRASRAAKI